MKRRFKILILLMVVMLGSELHAQHYFGVKGGWGGGSARLEPAEETNILWGMYNGGVSWRYYSKEKYAGGIQVDLEYMQRGYSYEYRNTPDTSYNRRLNSIVMPICWQPHFYFFGRTLKAFINLGVTFNYNMDMGSRYEIVSKRDGILEQGDYKFNIVRDNRWGFGLMGGFGLGVLVKRMEVFVEGRYYFGYSDILKNKTAYEPNPYQRSPMDNITVSAGVYFKLGHGDILSPPSKKVAAKLEQRRIKRELRDGPPVAEPPKEVKEQMKPEKIDKQIIEQNNGDNKTVQSGQTDTEGHK